MKNRFFIEDDDPFFSSGLWQPDRKNKTEDHISRHIVTPATHDKIYVAPSLFDQDHTGTPSESVSVPILQPVAEADPSASLQTANIANISALADANRRWDDNAVLGDALTLYYSIPDVMPSYSTGVTPLPFPTAHRNAIREIIGQTEALTNLTFVEVPTAQSAHVAFFYSDLDPGIAGGAYYPYAYETGSYVGDIFIDIAYTNNPPASAGDFQYHVIMHELGHALGLKHPFADTPNLPANEDNTNYTVMSYTRYLPYPSTYSIYDIAALQYLYGANASTNAGDTIYDLSLLLGTRQTIWDGGGIDTYDGSSLSHALYIDIAEGAFSTIDAVDNLATAFGAEIENVIGGSAGDSILGNGLDNEIIGGQGDDFLDGAGGTDEAVYSGHYADYTVNVSGGAGTITDNVGSDGTDTVINLERLIFANGVFENGVFTPNYVGPTIINGTPGNDVPLDGTSGDDIISGLDGADVIHGLAGNDQIDGGGWNDEIYGGDDNDTIF
ncbi:MAG: M10 family metallopeptidase C-terminal domain-containing protein, partial [Alphaproteobacteria bacterium]|nr:M10 family metallopeptidase C-terminal domain-containing protein [Alphaproteobacteria bacterium]